MPSETLAATLTHEERQQALPQLARVKTLPFALLGIESVPNRFDNRGGQTLSPRDTSNEIGIGEIHLERQPGTAMLRNISSTRCSGLMPE